jgi:hypothetical protein
MTNELKRIELEMSYDLFAKFVKIDTEAGWEDTIKADEHKLKQLDEALAELGY